MTFCLPHVTGGESGVPSSSLVYDLDWLLGLSLPQFPHLDQKQEVKE